METNIPNSHGSVKSVLTGRYSTIVLAQEVEMDQHIERDSSQPMLIIKSLSEGFSSMQVVEQLSGFPKY